MKNLIIGICVGSLISFLLFSLLWKPKNSKNICTNTVQYDSTKYKSIDLNGNCKTIILRSIIDTNSNSFNKGNSKLSAKELLDIGKISGPVDNDQAIEMIKNYYDKHNSDLSKTAFVDFNRNEVLEYLIDVLASNPKEKSNYLRIYFAARDKVKGDSICTIITSVSEDKKMEMNFINPGKLQALDWGGLRPPPKTKEALNNEYFATMLVKAIEKSEGALNANRKDSSSANSLKNNITH